MKASKAGGRQLSYAEAAASSTVKTACDIAAKAIIVLSETGNSLYHKSARVPAHIDTSFLDRRNCATARQIPSKLTHPRRLPRWLRCAPDRGVFMPRESHLCVPSPILVALHAICLEPSTICAFWNGSSCLLQIFAPHPSDQGEAW